MKLNSNAVVADGAIDPTHSANFNLVTFIAGKPVKCEGDVVSPSRQWSAAEYPPGIISDYTIMRHCEACVFVYDVSNRASFEAVKWYHQNSLLERSLQRPGHCAFQCSPTCIPRPPYRGTIFVVANKIDRGSGDRVVTKREGEEMCSSIGAEYIEGSAKTGDCIGTALLVSMTTRILLERLRNMDFVGDLRVHAAEGYALPFASYPVLHRNMHFWY